MLLTHIDSGQLWPAGAGGDPALDVAGAYQRALEVRKLREARGEQPRGYKVGFTNRTIWPLYNVFAPIWGTVWDTTLSFCEGEGTVSLARTCQPRLEPEIVFGMRATPARGATLDQLFDAIEWMAPGFEIVQHQLRYLVSPTQRMISNLISVELAYINTSHPDFIGGKPEVMA